MADRHLFFGQRSISLAVAAAVVNFISGCSSPAVRTGNPSLVIPTITLSKPQKPGSDTPKEKALVAQQNQAYKKAITKLVQQERLEQLNTPIPLQFRGKTVREVKVEHPGKAVAQKTPEKLIALTFDDGPWEKTTSQILAILRKNNAKATFFVVGKQVEKYPHLLKQVVAEGHAVGNHSWSHQYQRFTGATATGELDKTAELVNKLIGVKVSLFRPPGGYLNNDLTAYARRQKYAVVMWSVDSQDWSYRRPPALVERVVKDAMPGRIVLLHDGGGDRSKTVEALPEIIAQLKKRGYKLVTVPELMKVEDKALVASTN